MAAAAMPPVSWESYLKMEREAEHRSEYFEGRMVAMSGGTLAHSRIAHRLAFLLEGALAGGPCTPVNSDLRVAVTATGPYFYPDASIYCGEPDLADGYRDMLLNPVVIFEILPQSRETLDRGCKFRQYRRMESLQVYVLISQAEACVEVFTRGLDGWWLTEYQGMEAVCELPVVGVRIALADLYFGVELMPETPTAPER